MTRIGLIMINNMNIFTIDESLLSKTTSKFYRQITKTN